MNQYEYFNRDLSWLSFNKRVLEEASDERLPIYERMKFMAIYASNLEEFYKVRMSYYRQLLMRPGISKEKIKQVKPLKIIREINTTVEKHQLEFHRIFVEQIVEKLKENGIILWDVNYELSTKQRKYLKRLFNLELLHTIQPVLLIKKKIKPFLKTGQVYIAIEMISIDSKTLNKKLARPKYGLIKLPTDHNISRFIEVPSHKDEHIIMMLEDLIMMYAHKIFTGYVFLDWHHITLTRDADLDYEDIEGDELIDTIQIIKKSRSLGRVNRFQYNSSMPQRMLEYLMQTFDVTDLTPVRGFPRGDFKDFFKFPNPLAPKLESENIEHLFIPEFENSNSIPELINRKDMIIHTPYHTYDYFIQFLAEAAHDDSVTEIKATQYRVAKLSEVVNALTYAAYRGKKVTVFVELKARFDEEANLQHAAQMEKAGIKIIYSIPNLKVHAKMALILRKKDAIHKSQAFLATGNFNEDTARLYGDHGLFTSNKTLIDDVENLFHHLESRKTKLNPKHILVPNINMLETYVQLIDNEIENKKAGNPAHIILKMNGFQDKILADKIYQASEAGVKIDLIVRGICVIRPDKPYSENIRIVRIIDRYLEHARVFYFCNNNTPIVYIGSADWMKRNLYRRIECVFPIFDEKIKQELIDILNIQLSDNVQACTVDNELHNIRLVNDERPVRSQLEIYNYLKAKIQ